MSNKGVKLIAVVLGVVFSASQAVQSAPAIEAAQATLLRTEISSKPIEFFVPADLGRIQSLPDAKPSDSNQPVIFHIQDAHGSYEAQLQIKRLIQFLNREYNVSTLLLEGAVGELEPDLFRFFKDDAINQKIADDLAKQGELTGAELFLLDEPKDGSHVKAYGIEDLKSYAQNLKVFRAVHERKDSSDLLLQKLESQLEIQGSRILNKSLRDFIKIWKSWRNKEIDLAAFLFHLRVTANKTVRLNFSKPENQRDYPMLVRYFKARELESNLKLKTAETEKQKFLQFLETAQVSPADVEAVRSWQIEQGIAGWHSETLPRILLEQIYTQVEPSGFQFEDYPELMKAWAILAFQKELEGRAFFTEIEKLTNVLFNTLAESDLEKEFVRLLEDLILMGKAFQLELARVESLEIMRRQNELGPEGFYERMKRHFPAAKVSPGWIAKGERTFEMVLRFYQMAIGREDRFVENSKKLLPKQAGRNAVLVAGGFHAEGLESLFQEQGFSLVEIIPRLTEIGNAKENYMNVMLDNRETLFDRAHIQHALAMQAPAVRESILQDGFLKRIFEAIIVHFYDTQFRRYSEIADLISALNQSEFSKPDRYGLSLDWKKDEHGEFYIAVDIQKGKKQKQNLGYIRIIQEKSKEDRPVYRLDVYGFIPGEILSAERSSHKRGSVSSQLRGFAQRGLISGAVLEETAKPVSSRHEQLNLTQVLPPVDLEPNNSVIRENTANPIRARDLFRARIVRAIIGIAAALFTPLITRAQVAGVIPTPSKAKAEKVELPSKQEIDEIKAIAKATEDSKKNIPIADQLRHDSDQIKSLIVRYHSDLSEQKRADLHNLLMYIRIAETPRGQEIQKDKDENPIFVALSSVQIEWGTLVHLAKVLKNGKNITKQLRDDILNDIGITAEHLSSYGPIELGVRIANRIVSQDSKPEIRMALVNLESRRILKRIKEMKKPLDFKAAKKIYEEEWRAATVKKTVKDKKTGKSKKVGEFVPFARHGEVSDKVKSYWQSVKKPARRSELRARNFMPNKKLDKIAAEIARELRSFVRDFMESTKDLFYTVDDKGKRVPWKSNRLTETEEGRIRNLFGRVRTRIKGFYDSDSAYFDVTGQYQRVRIDKIVREISELTSELEKHREKGVSDIDRAISLLDAYLRRLGMLEKNIFKTALVYSLPDLKLRKDDVRNAMKLDKWRPTEQWWFGDAEAFKNDSVVVGTEYIYYSALHFARRFITRFVIDSAAEFGADKGSLDFDPRRKSVISIKYSKFNGAEQYEARLGLKQHMSSDKVKLIVASLKHHEYFIRPQTMETRMIFIVHRGDVEYELSLKPIVRLPRSGSKKRTPVMSFDATGRVFDRLPINQVVQKLNGQLKIQEASDAQIAALRLLDTMNRRVQELPRLFKDFSTAGEILLSLLAYERFSEKSRVAGKNELDAVAANRRAEEIRQMLKEMSDEFSEAPASVPITENFIYAVIQSAIASVKIISGRPEFLQDRSELRIAPVTETSLRRDENSSLAVAEKAFFGITDLPEFIDSIVADAAALKSGGEEIGYIMTKAGQIAQLDYLGRAVGALNVKVKSSIPQVTLNADSELANLLLKLFRNLTFLENLNGKVNIGVSDPEGEFRSELRIALESYADPVARGRAANIISSNFKFSKQSYGAFALGRSDAAAFADERTLNELVRFDNDIFVVFADWSNVKNKSAVAEMLIPIMVTAGCLARELKGKSLEAQQVLVGKLRELGFVYQESNGKRVVTILLDVVEKLLIDVKGKARIESAV